jgi:hypothetical protein
VSTQCPNGVGHVWGPWRPGRDVDMVLGNGEPYKGPTEECDCAVEGCQFQNFKPARPQVAA